MFNLPNKITLSRIALIPVFMVIMLVPFQWGAVSFGSESIPVTHLSAQCCLFSLRSPIGLTAIMQES